MQPVISWQISPQYNEIQPGTPSQQQVGLEQKLVVVQPDLQWPEVGWFLPRIGEFQPKPGDYSTCSRLALRLKFNTVTDHRESSNNTKTWDWFFIHGTPMTPILTSPLTKTPPDQICSLESLLKLSDNWSEEDLMSIIIISEASECPQEAI